MNREIAARLEEAAWLLRQQGADPYRTNAYLRAAASVRRWPVSLHRVFQERGLGGLQELPGVGPTIARAIRELIVRGRLPMLDRLRGAADAVAVLMTVPGVGRQLAERLHDELGLQTLEELEAAAHDGRLETIAGFGPKRLAGIRDSLAHRLGRLTPPPAGSQPEVALAELLDVDREYRTAVAAGRLRRIAPRRMNPTGEAWLPILHTRRGPRSYTALYSNTARAHRAGKTRDWVVLYVVDDAGGTRQYTVLTAQHGPLCGRRIVAGRENEGRPPVSAAVA
jgi:hypothetical protein